MSALTVSSLGAWVPASVFLASLLGSAHCAGMCGGLVTSLCPTPGQAIRYHAGRLLAYGALGLAAGTVGHSVFSENALEWLSWFAAILMSALFGVMGYRVWRGQPLHFRLVPQPALSFLYKRAGQAPLVLGALSAALPCGWLQSFVLAAAAIRSAAAGGLLMAAFWLGTIPALAATPWLARRFLRPASRRAPKLAALLLIAAGLWGVGFKMSTLWAKQGMAHCHGEFQKTADSE